MNHGYIEYEALLASASDRARKAAQQVAVTSQARSAATRKANERALQARMLDALRCENGRG
jgi:hypothetical protein